MQQALGSSLFRVKASLFGRTASTAKGRKEKRAVGTMLAPNKPPFAGPSPSSQDRGAGRNGFPSCLTEPAA